VPIIFLLPLLYLLSYGVMHLLRLPLPDELHIPFLLIPILFAVFFITAVGEEVGWMGYAVDPLQEQQSALTTGIVLGSVRGIFHVVPDIQANHGLA
jgi:membrane protease YdiL (CAAX protease family)